MPGSGGHCSGLLRLTGSVRTSVKSVVSGALRSRPGSAVRCLAGAAGEDVVAVAVASHGLVHPAFAHGSSSVCGSVQCGSWVASGCDQEAEVLFLRIEQRRKRNQVVGLGFGVENGVEVDLVVALGGPYLDVGDTNPVGRFGWPEELLDGTSPLEDTEEEWPCQVLHVATLGAFRDWWFPSPVPGARLVSGR